MSIVARLTYRCHCWSEIDCTIRRKVMHHLEGGTYLGISTIFPCGMVVEINALSHKTVIKFSWPRLTTSVISASNGKCPISCFTTICPFTHCKLSAKKIALAHCQSVDLVKIIHLPHELHNEHFRIESTLVYPTTSRERKTFGHTTRYQHDHAEHCLRLYHCN